MLKFGNRIVTRLTRTNIPVPSVILFFWTTIQWHMLIKICRWSTISFSLVTHISYCIECTQVPPFNRLMWSPHYGVKKRDNSIEDFVHGYSLPWELEAIGLTVLSVPEEAGPDKMLCPHINSVLKKDYIFEEYKCYNFKLSLPKVQVHLIR